MASLHRNRSQLIRSVAAKSAKWCGDALVWLPSLKQVDFSFWPDFHNIYGQMSPIQWRVDKFLTMNKKLLCKMLLRSDSIWSSCKYAWLQRNISRLHSWFYENITITTIYTAAWIWRTLTTICCTTCKVILLENKNYTTANDVAHDKCLHYFTINSWTNYFLIIVLFGAALSSVSVPQSVSRGTQLQSITQWMVGNIHVFTHSVYLQCFRWWSLFRVRWSTLTEHISRFLLLWGKTQNKKNKK